MVDQKFTCKAFILSGEELLQPNAKQHFRSPAAKRPYTFDSTNQVHWNLASYIAADYQRTFKPTVPS